MDGVKNIYKYYEALHDFSVIAKLLHQYKYTAQLCTGDKSQQRKERDGLSFGSHS